MSKELDATQNYFHSRALKVAYREHKFASTKCKYIETNRDMSENRNLFQAGNVLGYLSKKPWDTG